MNAMIHPPIPILSFDAALPGSTITTGYIRPVPYAEAAAHWLAEIEREQLKDFAVSHLNLIMRQGDGAFVGKVEALAYTPHGFSQLLTLQTSDLARPNNLPNCVRWLSPNARAHAYADIRIRSKRSPEDCIVLRTYLDVGRNVRVIRAAVSARHSGVYLDDKALEAELRAELHNARTSVVRGVDATSGYAVIGDAGPYLERTFHWRNSETGCASMSFATGARIHLVDAVVQLGESRDSLELDLSVETDAARIRHTSPGGARKARVALDRMRSKIRKVLAGGDNLEAMWTSAAKRFTSGGSAAMVGPSFEVLLDAIEEHGGSFEGDDRAALSKILTDDTRLSQLPRGSAAHLCAAFAVLGARSESVVEAERYQQIAGRWMARGWM